MVLILSHFPVFLQILVCGRNPNAKFLCFFMKLWNIQHWSKCNESCNNTKLNLCKSACFAFWNNYSWSPKWWWQLVSLHRSVAECFPWSWIAEFLTFHKKIETFCGELQQLTNGCEQKLLLHHNATKTGIRRRSANVWNNGTVAFCENLLEKRWNFRASSTDSDEKLATSIKVEKK